MTASEPDRDVRQLLDRWAKAPRHPRGSLTAEAVRADDRAVLALQRSTGGLHSIHDLVAMTGAGPVPVRVYRPCTGRIPAVLYLHGGGFVVDRSGYEAPLREMALASGCLVVAPTCRLAPEHPFPAALDDALAVAAWLRAKSSALGATPVEPAIAGDSSGGNLAAVVALALARQGAPPSYQLLIYPMLDATATSPSYQVFAEGYGFTAAKSRWYFDQYLGRDIDRRSPQVSPLFDDGELGELPQTLIVTAELDPLRDDGERYARKLQRAGVTVDLRRYDGVIHGFFQMTGALERSRQLHRDLGTWMRQAAFGARRP